MAPRTKGMLRNDSEFFENNSTETLNWHDLQVEYNSFSRFEPAPIHIYPYNAICLLLITDAFSRKFQATGFFISRSCVLTAAHNLFNNRRWVKQVLVIQKASSNTGTVLNTSKWYVLNGWKYNHDQNFDLGSIILQPHASQPEILPLSLSTRTEIEVSGYPQNKNGNQWKNEGVIYQKTKFRYIYDIPTSDGYSGSPIFYGSSKDDLRVSGVNIYGGSLNSEGLRFNDSILHEINKWTSINP